MTDELERCVRCNVETGDTMPWCETCGPPGHHPDGCECKGCAMVAETPKIFGVDFGFLVDSAMIMFGSPERKQAAARRLTIDAHKRAMRHAMKHLAENPIERERDELEQDDDLFFDEVTDPRDVLPGGRVAKPSADQPTCGHAHEVMGTCERARSHEEWHARFDAAGNVVASWKPAPS